MGGEVTELVKYPKILDQQDDILVKNLYKKTDIDKGIVEFFDELINEAKELNQNHYYVNMKILIGLVALGVGALGQFVFKFPHAKFELTCCIAVYAILSGFLLFLDYYYIAQLIISFNFKGDGPYLLYGDLPLFKSDHKLTLKYENKSTDIIRCVGEYFFNNGVLDKKLFCSDLNRLLGELRSDKKKN